MRIITRAEWGASTPVGRRMTLPVDRLYLHHSVTTATSNPVGDMRTIERIGRERFGIVSYSYVVHPLGHIFEGAGDTVGAHTRGENSSALAACLVGNYEHAHPTDEALDAVVWLAGHLRSTGRLRRTSALLGHRDSAQASTACPGRHVYAAIPALRERIDAPTTPPQREDDDMARLVQDDEGRIYVVSGVSRSYIGDPATVRWLAANGHVPSGTPQRIPTAVLRDAYPIEAEDPQKGVGV